MLFDLVEDRILIADPWQMVVAREEDEFRSGDLLGEVPSLVRAYDPVSRPLEDERGTWIADRTGRTSISAFIRTRVRAACGLALCTR